jgi:hypothetical protein
MAIVTVRSRGPARVSRQVRRRFARSHSPEEVELSPNLPAAIERKVSATFLCALFREDWVVRAKLPFGGPRHVLLYLAHDTQAAVSPTRAK